MQRKLFLAAMVILTLLALWAVLLISSHAAHGAEARGAVHQLVSVDGTPPVDKQQNDHSVNGDDQSMPPGTTDVAIVIGVLALVLAVVLYLKREIKK